MGWLIKSILCKIFTDHGTPEAKFIYLQHSENISTWEIVADITHQLFSNIQNVEREIENPKIDWT